LKNYKLNKNDIEMKETRIFFIEECCICLENLYKNNESESKDYIKMLCCKKNLHKDCLLQSFLVNPKCCLCRSEINIKKYFNDKLILKIFNTYTQEFRSEHITQIKSITDYTVSVPEPDYTVSVPEPDYTVNARETRIWCCTFLLIIVFVMILSIIIDCSSKYNHICIKN
jgi:hypothetical protein